MNAQPASAAVTQALALWRSGRHEEARRLCESLADSPADSEALSLLAEICAASGQFADAVRSLRRLGELRGGDAAVQRRLGNALLAGGSAEEAVVVLRRAVALEPDNVRGHNNLGQALMRVAARAEALASYERAIAIEPNYAVAHNNLGVVHFENGAYESALSCYRRALELDPALTEANTNCGNVLLKLKRPQEALACHERGLATAAALIGRATAQQQTGDYRSAIETYDRVLQREPDHPVALCNYASALLALKRPEEALEVCARALALDANLAEAHSNLGGALRLLNRLDEAARACQRALQLKPDMPVALSNLASILLAWNRASEALAYCDQALELDPAFAQAHDNRGRALTVAKRLPEAVETYRRLVALDRGHRFALGCLLGAQLSCCDWRDYETLCADIARTVGQGQATSAAFDLLSVSDSEALHLRCAQLWTSDAVPANIRVPWSPTRHAHERIRIAYLSADFHYHATALLAAGLFEAHDRKRFEITALSFGPEDAGAMRARLLRAFDEFIDVRGSSDARVTELLRAREIDIAVDLKGHTTGARPGILARRAAPVQVSYLGYPGTMGLEQIDYIIADATVLPPGQQHCYSEQVVYLPESYQVNDAKRIVADRTPTRAEVDLPARGFVFCCFNNPHKINPRVFDVWMRALRAVPDSVLWLLQDNAAVVGNLRREAAARGVDAGRLIFAPRLSAEEHLARHRLADLFLDTLPYNAHTTASDSLWVGVPLLTCLGHAFAGRVAASLLYAVGLPQLITHDLDAYFARAVELATDRTQLAGLRRHLNDDRFKHPLFDTQRFCRHLEAAYTTMWQRQEQGSPPRGFAVPAAPRRSQVVPQGGAVTET
jgi:protein O-GlcNAc transferase